MEYISSGALFIIGSIFGFFINKILEKGFEWGEKSKKKSEIKNKIKSMDKSFENLNINQLVNGYPEFIEKNIDIKVIDKSLYIGFPEDMIGELAENKRQNLNLSTSFDGTANFLDISKETEIENLGELIEKHRRIVAQNFIDETNGCYFNGEKYGVYEINGFERTPDSYEYPILKMKLFNTDYFTHKVFKSIYKEIKDIHPIGKTNLSDLKKYRSFATSFGINGIVKLCSGVANDSIILTRRAMSATDTNGEELYSVSVIEGLTKTDDKYEDKKVDLYQCFKRGMTEELGIKENMYSPNTIKFYDVFLELNKFEIGITCCVELNDEYIFETDIKDLMAKDNILEVADKFAYPFNQKAINRILKEKKFNKQSIFTIKSVLIR